MDEGLAWVLDTNVVVSGLLSAQGPPGRLLDMVLGRRLRMTLDDRIVAEYREVLARPKFAIDSGRLEAFLVVLQFQHNVMSLPWRHSTPLDPDDAMFLEAALSASGKVLVTGNLKHYPRLCRGPVTVLSPREAWQRIAV